MHKEGDEVHVDDTEASGGSKEGVVRWVLGISLLAAIVVMSLVWIVPALTNEESDDYANVSDQLRAEDDGDSTDSIVGVGDDPPDYSADQRTDGEPTE